VICGATGWRWKSGRGLPQSKTLRVRKELKGYAGSRFTMHQVPAVQADRVAARHPYQFKAPAAFLVVHFPVDDF